MERINYSYFIATAMVLLASLSLTGCRIGASKAELAKDTMPASLATDSIVFNEKSDSTAECKIIVDYPTGDDSLAMGVRNYIARELSGAYLPLVNADSDRNAYAIYSGNIDNGKDVVSYYGKGTLKYLKEQCRQLREAGMGEVPHLSYEVSVRKTYENNAYVTYTTSTYSFLGGAHGSALTYSVNIAKSSADVVEQIVDTTKTLDLQPLLRAGVVRYLKSNGDKNITEKNLGDYLFVENGVVPLPANTPYLAKDGVHFVYQQYEIGPYAMGMVTFTVPYPKIKQFLTKEAKTLIE